MSHYYNPTLSEQRNNSSTSLIVNGKPYSCRCDLYSSTSVSASAPSAAPVLVHSARVGLRSSVQMPALWVALPEVKHLDVSTTQFVINVSSYFPSTKSKKCEGIREVKANEVYCTLSSYTHIIKFLLRTRLRLAFDFVLKIAKQLNFKIMLCYGLTLFYYSLDDISNLPKLNQFWLWMPSSESGFAACPSTPQMAYNELKISKNDINIELLREYDYETREELNPEDNQTITIFICKFDGCNKEFKRTWNMLDHARTHKGVKPFACQYWPRRFIQKGNLKKHLKQHFQPTLYERKKFLCRIWNCRYTEKYNFKVGFVTQSITSYNFLKYVVIDFNLSYIFQPATYRSTSKESTRRSTQSTTTKSRKYLLVFAWGNNSR